LFFCFPVTILTAKDGYRRKRIGSLISRGRTKEQIKLKVKIIYAK